MSKTNKRIGTSIRDLRVFTSYASTMQIFDKNLSIFKIDMKCWLLPQVKLDIGQS